MGTSDRSLNLLLGKQKSKFKQEPRRGNLIRCLASSGFTVIPLAARRVCESRYLTFWYAVPLPIYNLRFAKISSLDNLMHSTGRGMTISPEVATRCIEIATPTARNDTPLSSRGISAKNSENESDRKKAFVLR